MRAPHASYGGPIQPTLKLRPLFPQPPIVPTVADDQRSRVTVTVDQDGEIAPKLNVRFSHESLPTVDRALAIAFNEDISAGPPTRKRSIKANQGLYRVRPEYFVSFPTQTSMMEGTSQRVVSFFEDGSASQHGQCRSMRPSEEDEAYELEALHDIMEQFPSTPIAFATNTRVSPSPLLQEASQEENPFSDSVSAVSQATTIITKSGVSIQSPRHSHDDAVNCLLDPSSKLIHPDSTEDGTRDKLAHDSVPHSPLSPEEAIIPAHNSMQHHRVPTPDLIPSYYVSHDSFAEQRYTRKEHSASAPQSISSWSSRHGERHACPGTLDTSSSRHSQESSVHPASLLLNTGTCHAVVANNGVKDTPGSRRFHAMSLPESSSRGEVKSYRTPEIVDGSMYHRKSLGIEIGRAV